MGAHLKAWLLIAHNVCYCTLHNSPNAELPVMSDHHQGPRSGPHCANLHLGCEARLRGRVQVAQLQVRQPPVHVAAGRSQSCQPYPDPLGAPSSTVTPNSHAQGCKVCQRCMTLQLCDHADCLDYLQVIVQFHNPW